MAHVCGVCTARLGVGAGGSERDSVARLSHRDPGPWQLPLRGRAAVDGDSRSPARGPWCAGSRGQQTAALRPPTGGV